MARKLYYKESIRSLLESIAILDEMVGPDEMVCQWYDDLYFPCQNNKELYNEGVWEQGQKEWRGCFTHDELKALAKFHEVFEQLVNSLPDDPLIFSNDPNWKELQAAAKRALQEIEN